MYKGNYEKKKKIIKMLSDSFLLSAQNFLYLKIFKPILFCIKKNNNKH